MNAKPAPMVQLEFAAPLAQLDRASGYESVIETTGHAENYFVPNRYQTIRMIIFIYIQ